MSAAEIDAYLGELDEPKRSTLEQLRRDILEVIPLAEQVISYSMPGFRVDGKVVAGLAAFTHHLSYVPHSGSVLQELDLSGYSHSKSALRFPVDQPLPAPLVRRLIEVRLEHVRRGRSQP